MILELFQNITFLSFELLHFFVVFIGCNSSIEPIVVRCFYFLLDSGAFAQEIGLLGFREDTLRLVILAEYLDEIEHRILGNRDGLEDVLDLRFEDAFPFV